MKVSHWHQHFCHSCVSLEWSNAQLLQGLVIWVKTLWPLYYTPLVKHTVYLLFRDSTCHKSCSFFFVVVVVFTVGHSIQIMIMSSYHWITNAGIQMIVFWMIFWWWAAVMTILPNWKQTLGHVYAASELLQRLSSIWSRIGLNRLKRFDKCMAVISGTLWC